MKKLLALATIFLHIFTFSLSGYAGESVWTDQDGNVVASYDGNGTFDLSLLDGQVVTCAGDCNFSENQILNIQILNNMGIADREARALLQIASLDAVIWDQIFNLIGTLGIEALNGIEFGENFVGNIDGGAIFSTLGISQEDFFAGVNELSRLTGQDPAAIINNGRFNLADNSFLGLIASAVQNNGVIHGGLGSAVVMAAGDSVTMDISGGAGLISVQVNKAIEAEVYDKDGNKIADAISNAGQITADGGLAILTARASEAIFDNVINHTGIIEANTVREQEGKIILDGGDEGVTRVDGDLIAAGDDVGENGGKADVLGDTIVVTGNTNIEVSGYANGGEAHVGGDYQGLGSRRTASSTTIAPEAIIKADSILEGDGGKVVVWSDGHTEARGYISAKGGTISGNGGLIETSGKETLNVTGIRIDASASNGDAGAWLLDPRNITIENNPTSGGATPNFVAGADDSVVDVADIEAALNGGTSVTINTGATGTQDGDITIKTGVSIDKTAGGNASFTLDAFRNIIMETGSGITATVGQLIVNFISATGKIDINGGITTNGGAANLTANGVGAGDVTFGAGGQLNTGIGDVTIQSSGIVSGIDDITSEIIANNVNITAAQVGGLASALDMTINGALTIDTSAVDGNVRADMQVGTINLINAAGGDVTLQSINGLKDAAGADTTVDIIGNNVSLTSNFGGTIGTSVADSLNVNATTLSTNTSGVNGNQFITEADGVLIGNMNAGTGNITLNSGSGAIDSANNDGVADMTASTINLTTTTGHIGNVSRLEVTAGTAFNATTGDRRVFVDSIGDLVVGNVNAVTSRVDLRSTGSINSLNDDGTADITARNIDLTASAGGIGTTSNVEVSALDVFNATTTADNGNIVVDSIGAFPVGAINAGTGNVTLNSTGAITDANAAAVNVIGGILLANAAGGMDLDTTIASLNATTTAAGDVDINETNLITLTNLQVNDGTVNVNAGSSITAVDVDTANKDVTLTSVNGLHIGDVNAGTADVNLSGVNITNAAGDVTAGTLNITNANLIGTVGNRFATDVDTLNVTATVPGGAFITEANGIDLNTVNSNGGFDLIATAGDITATSVATTNTTVKLDAQAGNIQVGSITGGTGNVTLSSTGFVRDTAGNDTTTDVTGNVVTITSGTGIGQTADDALNLAASKVAVNTTAGNAFITGATSLIFTGVSNVVGNLVAKSLGGNIESDGTQTLTVSGNANFDSAAADTFLFTGTNNYGSVTANGDEIALKEASSMDVAGATATTSLLLNAGGDITDSGTITTPNLQAFNIVAPSGSVILDEAGNDFDTAGIGANGVIQVNDVDDLTIQKVNANYGGGSLGVNGFVTTATHSVNVTTGGNLAINNADGIRAGIVGGGDVTINSGGIVSGVDNAVADIRGATIDITAAQIGASALDVTATSAVNANTSGSNGKIEIDSIGAFPLGTINAGTGDVTLEVETANDAMTDANDGATPDAPHVNNVTGGTITLNTNGGDIGALANKIEIDPSTQWNANSNGGGINIHCMGDCPLGQINAGTATFAFSAGGNISDGNDAVTGEHNGGVWNITAGGLVLEGGTGVGAAGNSIETRLSDFNGAAGTDGRAELSGGTGGVYLANAAQTGAGLMLGGIGSLANAVAAQGGIEILSGSPLNIAADVIDNAGGNILLAALGNANTDKVAVNANVTATGGNGNVDIYAGSGIEFGTSGKSISAAGTGAVNLIAGEDFTDATINQDGNANGTIDMDRTGAITGVGVTSAAGNILLDASGAVVDIQGVNAGTGDVTILARGNGGITGRTDDGIADVTGSTVNLTANAGGIEGRNAFVTALDVSATTKINADASGVNGPILIDGIGGFPVGSINAGTGNVVLKSTTGFTDADADAASDITATNLTAIADNGTFGAAGANNAIDTTVASATVNTSAANGSQFINETDGLSDLDLNAGTGDVTLTTGGAITDTAADGADVQATNFIATVAGAFGAVANAIETTVASLSVNTSAANGTQTIVETDGLTDLDLNAGTGNVNLTTGGAIVDTAADGADIQATNAVVVINGAGGDFGQVANAIETAVSDLSVDTSANNNDQFISEADGLAELLLNAGTGNINLSTLGAGSIFSADTGVDIIAQLASVNVANGAFGSTNVTAGNAIETTVGTLNVDTSVGNGNQFILETDDVAVGLITAGGGDVSLTAGGVISAVADDATADVVASTINLVGTAIGASALDVTATTQFNANTSAANGKIEVDSIGNLPVGLVNAGTGQVDIDSTGNITDANDGGTPDAPAVNNIIGGVINLIAQAGGIGSALNALDFLASTNFSATTTADNSNINVRSVGDAPINLINAGTGNVTLTSEGNISDFNNDANANVIGGTIDLVNVTNAKDMGSVLNYFDIQPATLWNVTTNNGNAFINCIGACPVDKVDVGTALFAYSGTMTDGNDAVNGERTKGGEWNIKAGGFHAQGTNGIGTDINWIETRLQDPNGVGGNGQLQANGGTGGVFISNTGGLGLDANSGLTITDILPATFGLPAAPDLGLTNGIEAQGGIVIDSNSPLVVNANVLENAGNNILLSANGTTANDDVTIDAGVSVIATGGNGNVTVLAGDDVNMSAGSLISAAGTGTVNVGAGEDATNGAIFAEADGNANASLEMNATAAIRSEDGTINVRTTEDARISEVNANSNADATLGNVNITADTNSNNVGRIEDENGATVNITGDVATLRAATGIGVDGANTKETLETNINTLDSINTTSGHVVIRELAIGGALGILRAFQQGAGDHEITTEDGTLTVNANLGGGQGVTSTSGETLLQANGAGSDDDLEVQHIVTSTTGKINLDSTSRDVHFLSVGDVTATTGAEIEVFAQRSIVMNDGAVINANAGGNGTATGGDLGVGIDMDAVTGDITLGSVQTTSTAATSRGDANDAVSLNALVGAVIDGGDADDDIIANSGETQISTANGIGQGNSIDTQIDRLDATNSATNDIDVVETAAGGALNIVRVDQNATTGRVNVQTSNGTLTVLAEGAGGNAGNGVEAVDGQTFLIANGAGNDDDLVINNQIESRDGKINVDSTSRDVIASADGDITTTTGAEIESSAQRNITMANGAIWNANAGGTGGNSGDVGVGIDLDAATGNVTLGSIQTTSTAATSRGDVNDAVDITALNGQVIDGGDANIDIAANSGQVMIQTANGVGHGNAIETRIDRLEITNSTSRDIRIREQNPGGELNLTKIDQNAPTGQIDIRTGNGHLTVLDEGSITDIVAGFSGVSGLAGQIFLIARGGGANDDLIINNQIDSTTGKINVDSNSRDVIASAEGDITATGGAEIESRAVRNITMADGAVWDATSGSTGGQSGQNGVGIDLDAINGDIRLGSVRTTSAFATSRGQAVDAVDIQALNGAVIDNGDSSDDIIANSGQVMIQAANGVGHGNSIETQIDRLEIINSTSNDIDIRETAAGGELNLTRIDQNAATGRIDIQTLDGHLTVLADADVSDLNNFDGVEGLAGEIFLRANGAGANDDLRLYNNTESSTGKINFDSSSRDVIADANGDAEATGGAQIEVDAERHVTMADGTVWNANAGDGVEGIDIDADTGNVTLGSVQTSSNSATAVVISARNGMIIDGGDTDLDIITGAVTLAASGSVLPGTGGGMLLRAGKGIGSRGTGTNGTAAAGANFFAPDALDTQGGRLAARTESGDIQIHNTGGIEVTTLTDGDSPSGQGAIGAGTVVGLHIEDPAAVDPASIIFLTASSPMLVSSVVNNFDGGNISLYAVGGTAGDIMDINANITSADNNVASAASGNGFIRLISGGDMNLASDVTVATRNDGVTSGTGQIIAGAGFNAATMKADEAVGTLLGGVPVGTPPAGYPQSNLAIHGQGALVTNAAANINMNSNADESQQATFTTEVGDIRVDAGNDINLGKLDTDGNGGTNGITDGARGDVYTNSINGDTVDSPAVPPGTDATGLDILAQNVFMYANGIIGTDSNNIETDAPFITTFSVTGDQFINNIGDVQVNLNSVEGNINFRTTNNIFLGTVTAEGGEANLQAGSNILNTTGGNVTANSAIRLIAGGIIGTTTTAVDTVMKNPGTLFIGAGGEVDGLSANVTGNFTPTALAFLGTPPGLVLFNQSSVPAGGTVDNFLESVSTLFVPALTFNNSSYGEFDGQTAADFPGYFNVAEFASSPIIPIGTSAIDSIQVIGIQVRGRDVPATVIPVPRDTPAPVETPATEATQAPVDTDIPPAIVAIPEDAGAPAQGTTGDQVQI